MLSARETDVLRRVSLGQRERDIARALRLSTGAVRTHADAIIDKLGCTMRQGATLRALTLGLI
jgi:DNA-binding NarL/FixJ family response regulator